MSKLYSVVGPSQAGTGPNTIGAVNGGTTIRPMVVEIIAGVSTTPADQTLDVAVSRFTALGTGTAFTPNPLDPADPASVSAAKITHSAEPTYTASQDLLQMQFNSRATWRWVCQDGRELIGAAATNNGLGMRNLLSSASLTAVGTIIFRE